MAFRDPFKMVPISDLAEIADKLSRNEIVTPNEFRQFIGIKPSKDPKADKLLNSNMPQPNDMGQPPLSGDPPPVDGQSVDDTAIQSAMDDLEGTVDQILADLSIS